MEHTEHTSTSPLPNEGMSYETKTIIVVLLLLFFTPAGLILMWIWMKWPTWVKVLLTVIPFLFTFLVIFFVFAVLGLVFSNPEVQKQMNEQIKNENINVQNSSSPQQLQSEQEWEVSSNPHEKVVISDEYTFDIDLPEKFSIAKNKQQSLTKVAAELLDERGEKVLRIYTFAAGERSPVGNTIIDNVPFTINYFKDIQCLADLNATNWVPGTEPLFGIQVLCENATQTQLNQYKSIIQSITFSPALKNVLNGKVIPQE